MAPTRSRSSSTPAAASEPSGRPTTPSAKPKSKPKTSSAAATPGSSPRTDQAPKRRRLDWEAIERDFATGKYTDGELAAKHQTSRETINRQRAKDQKADPRRWQKDLTRQVRDATQALLMHEAVTKEVTGTITAGHTATAILVAAEVSKQVILQHRHELQAARTLAMELLAEVQSQRLLAADKELLAQVLAGNAEDIKQVNDAQRVVHKALATGSRVASVKALAETLTKLHSGERVAFSLDGSSGDEPPPPPDLSTIPPEQRQDAYLRYVSGLR